MGSTPFDLDFLALGLPEEVEKAKYQRDYSEAKRIIEWYLKRDLPDPMRRRLEFELLRFDRLRLTYTHSLDEALKEAKGRIKNFTDDEFRWYLERGFIDYILWDGKIYVEKRFVDNLGFLFPEISERLEVDEERKRQAVFLEERIKDLINGGRPKSWRIKARISSRFPKPSGKKVRVWLPIPRENLWQEKVEILALSHGDAYVSSNENPQRTVYFEGYDTEEFYVEFQYVSKEDFSPELYQRALKGGNFGDAAVSTDEKLSSFLEEKWPHIVINPAVKLIARRISEGNKGPLGILKQIYDFVTLNVRYSYVRPYIFYDNIPQFVLENLKGDCGFQALLFITLARALGIPAGWQSGWYITPYGASPHDWAVANFGQFGIRRVDLSFGGKRKGDEERRIFYFGNLDGFRMIANDDFMAIFDPPTNFVREDPYDNQVGEAEFEDGKAFGEHRIEVLDFSEA